MTVADVDELLVTELAGVDAEPRTSGGSGRTVAELVDALGASSRRLSGGIDRRRGDTESARERLQRAARLREDAHEVVAERHGWIDEAGEALETDDETVG